jgi:hypothetical protein
MIQKHLRGLASFLISACLLLSPLSDAWASGNGHSSNPADAIPLPTARCESRGLFYFSNCVISSDAPKYCKKNGKALDFL